MSIVGPLVIPGSTVHADEDGKAPPGGTSPELGRFFACVRVRA